MLGVVVHARAGPKWLQLLPPRLRSVMRPVVRHVCGQDYWIRVHEVLRAGPDQPATAAWRALCSPAAEGADLHLNPDELLSLLDSIALCPALSAELFGLHGRLSKHLFCQAEAFNGSQERRQFFRNQMLRLYSEKALHIRSALAALCEEGGSEDLAVEGILHSNEAIATEEVCDEGDSEQPDGRRSAAFLVAIETAEFLPASTKGDVFLARPAQRRLLQDGNGQNATRAEPGQDDDAACGPSAWFVGVAERVVAPQESRVGLLQLLLHPVGPQAETSLCDQSGTLYLIAPTGFLPSVLKRQRTAVLDLCSGCDRFSAMVQGLFFRQDGHRLAHEVIDAAAPCMAVDTNARLNLQQRLAVEAAASNKPLTLIEGPPGTGKTAVAVAIVQAWLQRDPRTPILVGTGTHDAKRLIASRLEKCGIRLSQRRDTVLKRKPKPGTSPVFVETVYMAALPLDRRLPRVLMDESSQVTEAAALVAMGQYCERIVLIGDPKQLGPVSNLGHLGISAAESLHLAYERMSVYEMMQLRHDLKPLRLREQYRMAQLLCDYPSRCFYAGELVTSADMEERPLPECLSPFSLLPHAAVEGQAEPTVFVDTTELEGCTEEAVSFHGARTLQNRLEASLAVGIIRALQRGGVHSRDISLLTGYAGQRDLLAEVMHGIDAVKHKGRWQQRASMFLLSGRDPMEEEPHPRVHSVHSFQGNESDFVVFSAVRSSESGHTGFIGMSQLVCVLLTRARRGLIIVGNRSTLRKDTVWGAWLDGARMQMVSPTAPYLESS